MKLIKLQKVGKFDEVERPLLQDVTPFTAFGG
jgi:hypothetical protein